MWKVGKLALAGLLALGLGEAARAEDKAVAGNPLEDIRTTEHPRLVMKAGNIVVEPGQSH